MSFFQRRSNFKKQGPLPYPPVTQDNSVKASIQVVVVTASQPNSVKANIKVTTSKDTSAKANILTPGQKPNSAKANIRVNNNTKANSAKANIGDNRFIKRSAKQFNLLGERFRFVGVNKYPLVVQWMSESDVDDFFDAAETAGIRVVRTWAFDTSTSGPLHRLFYPITAPNLISNPSVETNTTGWVLDTDTTRSNTFAHDGTWSIKQDADFGTYTYNYFAVSGLSAGTDYVWTFWHKIQVISGDGSHFPPTIRVQDSTGTDIKDDGILGSSNEWERRQVVFNTGANTSIRLAWFNFGGENISYFDDMHLGAKPTATLEAIEEGYQQLDMVLDKARQHNIKLVLSLMDSNESNYNSKHTFVSWGNDIFGGFTDVYPYEDFFLEADIISLYEQTIADVVNRINTVNGRAYKDDDTIMSWELGNEIRLNRNDPSGINSLASDNLAVLSNPGGWVDNESTYIKSLDPNHLVAFSSAAHGWDYVRDAGLNEDWVWNGTYYGVDYEIIAGLTNIDYLDSHLYPTQNVGTQVLNFGFRFGYALATRGLGLDAQIADYVAKAKASSKPFVMGEVGHPREDIGLNTLYDLYPRVNMFERIFDKVFDAGGDGVLLWHGETSDSGSYTINFTGTWNSDTTNENFDDRPLAALITHRNAVFTEQGYEWHQHGVKASIALVSTTKNNSAKANIVAPVPQPDSAKANILVVNNTKANSAKADLLKTTVVHRGYAIDFDGVDDWITVSSPGFNIREFSISWWSDTFTQDSNFADQWNDWWSIVGASGGHYAAEIKGLFTAETGAIFTVALSGFAGTSGTDTTTDIRNTGRHHFVVTASQANNQVILYKDGINVSQSTWAPASEVISTLTVGSRTGDSGRAIRATVDNFRWFNTPISQAAVTNLYVYDAVPAGLVGEFLFDNLSAADTSGNGNNGTLSGTPVFTDGLVIKAALVKANIVFIPTAANSAKANIKATTAKDNSAKANILAAGQQPNSAKANILVANNTKASSAKANIKGPPAFPTTGVLDSFDRADNAATIGSSWSLAAGFGGAGIQGISSNTLYNPVGGFGNYSLMYWNRSTFGPDSEAYITIVTKNTPDNNDNMGIYVRLTDPGDATWDAYEVQANVDGNYIKVGKIVNNTGTVLGDLIPQTISNGDKLGIKIEGSTISVFYNTGSGWNYIGSRTDTTLAGAGYLAFYLPGNTQDGRWDDFGGGTVGILATNNAGKANILTTYYTGATYDWRLSTELGIDQKNRGFNS